MTSRRTVKSPIPLDAGAVNPNLAPGRRPPNAAGTLIRGVLESNPVSIGLAISLVESSRAEDRPAAMALLNACHQARTDALRIAISGPPGVGKSTLIDALGTLLLEQNHRIAVLAIDPSSTLTGGSILGDKTRMPRLASSQDAFIRPSPTSGVLGGVGRNTRPAITICEAAGFDVILVETVGVGQSETAVRGMVDFLLLLSLAGAGDELQGIKRGIVEVADLVAVSKADGANLAAAQAAASRLQSALRLFPDDTSGWKPASMVCSSKTALGISEIWTAVSKHRSTTRKSGFHQARRQDQLVQWFQEEVLARREERLSASASDLQASLIKRVSDGETHPYAAAEEFVLNAT